MERRIKLIFEGEYLNGERNGKGKEYYKNGNLKFEGDFLKGKRNGKEKKIGKEYDSKGNVIFEGKFLNDIRWEGKGKEYDKNGNLIFEGEYINGVRKGKVKNKIKKYKINSNVSIKEKDNFKR